jgi:hypothetical protein
MYCAMKHEGKRTGGKDLALSHWVGLSPIGASSGFRTRDVLDRHVHPR